MTHNMQPLTSSSNLLQNTPRKDPWYRKFMVKWRVCRGYFDLLESQKFGKLLLSWFRKLMVVGVFFMVLYTILGSSMLPNGNFFALFMLYVCAMAAGELATLVNVPPLTFMLIVGIIFRQISPITSGLQSPWSKALRKYAYSIIFLRAGFGVDVRMVLRSGPLVILVLSVLSPLIESAVAGGAAVGILGFTYPWGLLLGMVLSDVSPAVTVPILLDFTRRRLGTANGMPSVLLLSGTINAVVSITCYYFILYLLPGYASGSAGLNFARIILELLCGFGVGAVVALVVGTVFHNYDTLDQTVYMLGAAVGLIFGSDYIGYPGGGTLAVLTLGALAGPMMPKTRAAVEVRLKWLWLWTGQPLLFSLVGALVNFSTMDNTAIWKGFFVIVIGLIARAGSVYGLLRLVRAPFTDHELWFVTLTWCAKATVQATLAPIAVDMAASLHLDSDTTTLAVDVLTVGLLSIVLTAPITSWAMQRQGPRWLPQEPESEPAHKALTHLPAGHTAAPAEAQQSVQHVADDDVFTETPVAPSTALPAHTNRTRQGSVSEILGEEPPSPEPPGERGSFVQILGLPDTEAGEVTANDANYESLV